MDEKGYIKYQCEWHPSEAIHSPGISNLLACREFLYQKKLIGCYPNGIGYGNVSIRTNKNQFLITGSATGNLKKITAENISLVVDFNCQANYLKCKGPIKASSESLSHAIIYSTLTDIQAVIHIHNLPLWEKSLNVLPTTNPKIEYGTPEMAIEIEMLCQNQTTGEKKIIAMGGHREGLIIFGQTLLEAQNTLFNYL